MKMGLSLTDSNKLKRLLKQEPPSVASEFTEEQAEQVLRVMKDYTVGDSTLVSNRDKIIQILENKK